MGIFYWGEANNPRRTAVRESARESGSREAGVPFRRWENGCPDVGQGQGWTVSRWASAPGKTVRITDLVATNRHGYLNEARVRKYRNGGGGRPWVMEAHGERYVVDGHHRVTAAYRRGETHIRVRMLRVGRDR
jgi:hypothetical protein